MRLKFFISCTLFMACAVCGAVPVGTFENDGRVLKGKLANGLTYYIVGNNSPEGYADFALARLSGLSGEPEGLEGMTYLMTALSIADTRNFPDGEIVDFMNNMCLYSTGNFSVETNDWNTVLTCRNVPVKESAAADSMLFALYDMVCGTELDAGALAMAKAMVRNVHAGKTDLETRVEDSLRALLFKGTPFSRIPSAELISRTDGFTLEQVKEYYSRFNRPENMAVIICGDVDVPRMETMVSALFGSIPKSRRALPAAGVRQSPEYGGGRAVYITDMEACMSAIYIDHVFPSSHESLRNTAVPVVSDYMGRLLVDILRSRLDAAISSYGFHAEEADVCKGRFLGTDALESLRFSVKVAPGYAGEAYRFLMTETDRLMRYGITGQELDAALKRLSEDMDARVSVTGNAEYAAWCADNFTGNYAIIGKEFRKSYIDKVSAEMDVDMMDGYMRSVLASPSLLTVVSPEPEGLMSYMSPDTLERYEYVEAALPSGRKAGKLGRRGPAEFSDPVTGIVSMRLPNGAAVAYRKAFEGSGTVYFEAAARGGVSLARGDHSLLQYVINDVAENSRIGGLDRHAFRAFCENHGFRLDRDISISGRTIRGVFRKEDAGTFLQAVAAYFTSCTPDSAAFEKCRSGILGMLPYMGNSPERVFESLSGRVIRTKGEDGAFAGASSIAGLDYDRALSFVNSLFSNAARFTFMFAGDIDEDILADAIDRHIAPLPGKSSGRKRRNSPDFFIAAYDDVDAVKMPMSFGRTLYRCRLSVPSAFNVEDRVLSEVIASLIRREVAGKMAASGIMVSSSTHFLKFPEETMAMDFVFSTRDYYGRMEDVLADIVAGLAEGKVSPERLGAVKRELAASMSFRSITDGGYWLGVLKDRFVYLKDFNTRYQECLDAVTPEDVAGALAGAVRDGALTLYSVSPGQR